MIAQKNKVQQRYAYRIRLSAGHFFCAAAGMAFSSPRRVVKQPSVALALLTTAANGRIKLGSTYPSTATSLHLPRAWYCTLPAPGCVGLAQSCWWIQSAGGTCWPDSDGAELDCFDAQIAASENGL